uniref:PiggyBac transposable element-derived protein domain-containing protein n=1 Tax=Monopterus albus TaxID=43700 RepID=A0A3Q3J6M7_MONAL
MLKTSRVPASSYEDRTFWVSCTIYFISSQLSPVVLVCRHLYHHLLVGKAQSMCYYNSKMASISAKMFYSRARNKNGQERLLNAIVGENSDVEELSDGEEADPGVELLHDKDYIPPDLSESDQQSSDSDSEPPPSTECARKRKRGRSVEPGSSKNTSRVRWKSSAFTPDIVQFEAEEETLHERHNWQPLDYMEQYIDRELMNLIANCTNAMSLSNSGSSLNTSVDEIYHFFGASIFMSCVSYPQLRMFWSSALRIPAISDKLKRDRFFKLRKHLKVVIDSDISEDMRKADKFWKTRPFIDRILKGCLLQARPECVSIDEQMIPFTGACPFRQYVPLKPNPVGMKNFVLATAGGIVLDFEVYQGANSLRSQIQDAEELGLGALVIAHLAKSLHPGTKVYCDRFFTSMKAVDQMLEKQVYLTGTIMKNRVTEPLQKLPSDQDMKLLANFVFAQLCSGIDLFCNVLQILCAQPCSGIVLFCLKHQ